MDLFDNLFFDHRAQKKARVEPICMSQRNSQSFGGVPTFDDFLSTQNLKDDLSSFQPSQIIARRDKQLSQQVRVPASFQDVQGSQFSKPSLAELDFVHPSPRNKNRTGPDVFRRPAKRQQQMMRESGYGSDEDLFTDNSQCVVPTKRTKPFTDFQTPQSLCIPDVGSGQSGKQTKLRSVEEIPERYREIFSFPYFNIVQSLVLDDVLYTDKPMVVCAPTGSGKTAVFELAILRLLMTLSTQDITRVKIVYMAPIKALCSERYQDWRDKFEPFGLKCKELTGDTEVDDYFHLQEVNIVTTTPEKWDSMTRKWRDNKSLVQMVRLFLIDEVHVLNDDTRGATMEAVISRMKTVQSALGWSKQPNTSMRFIAVSATIPNIEDIAEWLGQGEESAIIHKLGDQYRPVRLRKVVLGYYCSEESSDFKFDITLNYKLSNIIHTYSENKPTLVFCSTRKSVQQAATVLVKDSKFIINTGHKERLIHCANSLRDSKLRELVLSGVGFHHAGLDMKDRKLMEELFLASDLPVLFATSTLAMGVNLPAHLVVIKSTTYYQMGSLEEYSDTQVLQMIGRAGRPQFDTSATAVIMTKNSSKYKYEALMGGTHVLESSLHKHLIEHLNAEICLQTISDVTVALEWLRSTLLYIRVLKNPKHYNMPVGLTKNQVEKRLQDLCITNLNLLTEIDLIRMDADHFDIKGTETGRMMARFCITYSTMKQFSELTAETSLTDMLTVLSTCKEFSDIQLRVNERRVLNTMNKDKNRTTIRFPMTGKIKSKDMKVNCLIQAQLGCLTVQDFALSQDTVKIFRVGQRVTRSLVEFLWDKNQFQSLLSAVLLCKCFKAKLWENSKFVTKQLEGIGPTLSNACVNAGITTFHKIEETNPRELELIVNRNPPFGNQLRDNVAKLPKYELSIEQVASYNESTAEISVTICLSNPEAVSSSKKDGYQHYSAFLIGDADNNVVLKAKISDKLLLKDGCWRRRVFVTRAKKGVDLDVCMISEDWVGLDVQSRYTPYYSGLGMESRDNENQEYNQNQQMGQGSNATELPIEGDRRPCFHRCLNKNLCGHDCCKNGIPVSNKRSLRGVVTSEAKLHTGHMIGHMDKLRNKMQGMPQTPSLRRIKPHMMNSPSLTGSLSQYAYAPRQPLQFSADPRTPEPQISVSRTTVPDSKGWDDLELYTSYRDDCNKNTGLFDEDDYLPDLISTKQRQSTESYHQSNLQLPADQSIDWDSDEGEEYGNFGLQTPRQQQNVSSYDMYSTGDFQDSDDEDDGDAVLLRCCHIDMPEIQRRPRYGSIGCGLTSKGDNNGVDIGRSSVIRDPRRGHSDDFQDIQIREFDRMGPDSARVQRNNVNIMQHSKGQGSQFRGQRLVDQNQDHLKCQEEQKLEPKRSYLVQQEKQPTTSGHGRIYTSPLYTCEALAVQDEGIHDVQPKEFTPTPCSQDQPSNRPIRTLANRLSQNLANENKFKFQRQQSSKASSVEHKQGQVFAWQAPKKPEIVNQSSIIQQKSPQVFNGGYNFGSSQKKPNHEQSRDTDSMSYQQGVKIRVGPKGDAESQDSQSYSPTIPQAREFVFAKQLYDDRSQQGTKRLNSRPIAAVKSSPTSRPLATVKSSPAFSSDGDDEIMAGYLENIEETMDKENLPTPQVWKSNLSNQASCTKDIHAWRNTGPMCKEVFQKIKMKGAGEVDNTSVDVLMIPSPSPPKINVNDFFGNQGSPEEMIPSFSNIFDNIF